MARPPQRTASRGGASMTQPVGVNGLTMSMGYVLEERDPALRGIEAARTYQRIALTPVIAAGLHAIDSVVRSVEWNVVPAVEDKAVGTITDEAKEEADWLRGMLIDEPSGAPWSDFISEVMSFIEYGYSLFEVVYERRDDGRIGIADIQPRSQDTIARWQYEPKTKALVGVVQLDPDTGREIIIPYEKCLHFTWRSRKRNPEGRSMLRAAYRSWKRKLRTEVLEDIGNDRDLTGVPVIYIPSTAMGKPEVLAAYTKLVRDVRFNEQAGLVLPSDPFLNAKGEPIGSLAAYRLELLSTNSTRDPNIRAKHQYLDSEMARLLATEFLLLGGGAGAYALSKDKTEFLSRAVKALLQTIAFVLNTKLVTRLWGLNGLSPETRPKLQPGDPTPDDLAALASYVSSLAAAGARMFPDDRLEDDLRRRGGLPPLPPDADSMLPDTGPDGQDSFGGGDDVLVGEDA